jgi:hypothetical protein
MIKVEARVDASGLAPFVTPVVKGIESREMKKGDI